MTNITSDDCLQSFNIEIHDSSDVDIPNPSLLNFVLIILLGVFLGSFQFIFNYLNSTQAEDYFYVISLNQFLMCLLATFFLYEILKKLIFYEKIRSSNFLIKTLFKNKKLSFLVSCFSFYCLLINLESYFYENKDLLADPSYKPEPNYFVQYLNSFTSLFLLYFLKVTLKDCFNFILCENFYSKSILESDIYMEKIRKFTEITPLEDDDNFLKYSKRLFYDLSNKKSTIKNDNKNFNFLLNLFNLNQNEKLKENTFIKYFKDSMEKRYYLLKMIKSKEEMILSLDKIMNFLFYPLIILSFLYFTGFSKYLNFLLLPFSVSFLGLGFALKQNLSKIVNLVIYVYIIKPFIYNDMIKYDNEFYYIKDLGLDCTTVVDKNNCLKLIKTYNFLNSYLQNYQRADYLLGTYVYKFDLDYFINNNKLIKSHLDRLSYNLNYLYSNELNLRNYRIKNNEIEADITCKVKIHFGNIKQTIKRIKSTSVIIKDMFDKYKINYL